MTNEKKLQDIWTSMEKINKMITIIKLREGTRNNGVHISTEKYWHTGT